MKPIQRSQFYAQVRTYLRTNEQLRRAMMDEALERAEEAETRHQHGLNLIYNLHQQEQNQEEAMQGQPSQSNRFEQCSTQQLQQNGAGNMEEASSFDYQLPQENLSSEIHPHLDETFYLDYVYLLNALTSANPEIENPQPHMEEQAAFDPNSNLDGFLNEVIVETSSLDVLLEEHEGNPPNQVSDTDSSPSLYVVTEEEDEGEDSSQSP